LLTPRLNSWWKTRPINFDQNQYEKKLNNSTTKITCPLK
jgi:hypothetical protein